MGPDPRNFNQRVSLGRNDLLIRTFLSSEEETAVKTVCGLKRPATMAQHNLANDLLREMREYDAWLQCDCIPGDSPAMNFAALKNNTGTLYLSSFNHEHAP
ncbi:hypothetical protein ACMDLX_004329, partial [Salmonella enterica]